MRTCVCKWPAGLSTGPPELLDQLTDALRAEPEFKLRQLALDRLEASVEESSVFLVRLLVEAKLGRIDGTKGARVR